jgi:phospholipid/cholesterol/gamma-HCH transport system permease protein
MARLATTPHMAIWFRQSEPKRRSCPRRLSEAIRQSYAILRQAFPAAMLSIAAWGFAGPGLQAGNFLVTFGSIDRSGGFMVVAILREFGTYVTATVVAGIVGTMFTAELGARAVRDELDALSTLGVDPVKDLSRPASPRWS